MNKSFILIFLPILSLAISANEVNADLEKIARSEYPTEALYKLWLGHKKGEQSLLRFYDALTEKHIIELDKNNPKKAIVTYFAKGGDDTDYIMQTGGPDFYGLRFKQIDNSQIYFCTQEIPSDAWFSYGVNEFKRTKASGLEGIGQSSTAHIYDGAVVGPDAPLSPYIHTHQSTPKGTLRELIVNSKFMDEERKIAIYLPAAYSDKIAHNLVIQFDGQNYTRSPQHGAAWEGWTPMPTILDNLIHEQKIGSTIAIFVLNKDNRRSVDLLSEKMSDFVALELVEWARKNYNISQGPSNVLVSGPSRAGFAAAKTALRHSNVVGGVLSQSGSFYYTLQDQENWPMYPEFEGKLILDYKRSPKLDIHFYLDVGLYDLGLAAVGTNRQLRDILDLKGYEVDYYQYKSGHSHLGWRHTLANGLIALLGK